MILWRITTSDSQIISLGVTNKKKAVENAVKVSMESPNILVYLYALNDGVTVSESVEMYLGGAKRN